MGQVIDPVRDDLVSKTSYPLAHSVAKHGFHVKDESSGAGAEAAIPSGYAAIDRATTLERVLDRARGSFRDS